MVVALSNVVCCSSRIADVVLACIIFIINFCVLAHFVILNAA